MHIFRTKRATLCLCLQVLRSAAKPSNKPAMLRSLSLAARHYASGGPGRTLIRGLSAETTTTQVQNPPKAKGDSEFVTRRREYRKCLHERRVVLQSELQREEVEDIEKDREEIAAARQARLERKRYELH